MSVVDLLSVVGLHRVVMETFTLFHDLPAETDRAAPSSGPCTETHAQKTSKERVLVGVSKYSKLFYLTSFASGNTELTPSSNR